MNDVLLYIRNFDYSHECTYGVRTLYIPTTNTVSVFPAKFIEYSLLLAYCSYLHQYIEKGAHNWQKVRG